MGMTRDATREAVRFLLGLVALAALTVLCFWLDFSVVSTAFAYLILIVLLSLAGGFISLIALSLIAYWCLRYFFPLPFSIFASLLPKMSSLSPRS